MRFRNVSSNLALTSLFSLAALVPTAAHGFETISNVPNGVSVSSDHGRLNSASAINITVHLKKQDEAAFKKAVDGLYDPASPTFHKWMTDEDLKKYAPSKSQLDAVRKELESHGLTVLSVDPNGFSIRARGPVPSVEEAFGTEIHEFERNGQVFRANVRNAHLTGAAAEYVTSVAGIESHQVRPMLKRPTNLKTNEPLPGVELSKVNALGGLGSILTDQALSAPQSFTLSTPGATLPVGLFYGNVYRADSTRQVGFTPQQLQSVYGLPAAYAKGLDGTGQTIVLLEAYGYPTIEADANAYCALTGLPLLTSSNFSIVYPQGKPVNPNSGVLLGWDAEIALDIDSAHAIAPKAKIVVVVAAGQSGEDFQAAMQYIVNNKIGYQVSDSWGEDVDLLAGPAENESYETILTLAAAKGISFQFSTGDSGDNGVGSPLGAAGVPSNAPHATAVGGTSILNFGNGFRTLGWGTSAVLLDYQGFLISPLEPLGLTGGSGGGESLYFPKPSWQKGLPGKGRQTPDVSALADPFTGFPIVVTSKGTQQIFVYGGTSLASPIFSALWALANQNSAKALGQAAPAVAALTAGQIIDVLPLTSPTSVSGTEIDTAGSTSYSIYGLFRGMLYDSVGFTSAIYDQGGSYFVLGFGLDSSLNVTKGWDNTTGYGTPNGLPFLNAVAGKK